MSLPLKKYFPFCPHALFHIPLYSLELTKMAVIKIGNFQILTIKRMEKRMTRESTQRTIEPHEYISRSGLRLNEILLGPKCLPWVDVKGLFVFKNASVLIFPFFSHPSTHTPTKKPFIGFVLCVEHFSYCIFCSFIFPEALGLSFLYLFLRVAKSFRRKVVGVCVFVKTCM